MKRLFLKILFCVDLLAIVAQWVCVYSFRKYDWVSGTVTDGFGRVLTKTPGFLLSRGAPEEWAGYGWTAVDFVCFLVLIGIAYILFESIWRKKD